MSDDDGAGWLEGAIESGSAAVHEFRTFLGIQREAFVCPECDTACEESTTFDTQTAAFNGGETPCWTCPDCNSNYYREMQDGVFNMDIYDR